MHPHPKISIRPYDPDDFEPTIFVYLKAIRETAARDYNPAQIEAWAQVDREKWAIKRQSRPTWIAIIDGSVAGFSDLEPDGHIDMMFVHPAYQRQGVASTLLQTVTSAARAQNSFSMTTEASLTACPFFIKHGFSVVTAQEVALRGQILKNFKMMKALA